MLQNSCKTSGFTKNMVYKIPPGGGGGGGAVNHIQPVAYYMFNTLVNESAPEVSTTIFRIGVGLKWQKRSIKYM